MSESEKPTSRSTTRREIPKAAFVAPAIITLAITPAFASAGSQDRERRIAGSRAPDRRIASTIATGTRRSTGDAVATISRHGSPAPLAHPGMRTRGHILITKSAVPAS
jgi:hypothetical protein